MANTLSTYVLFVAAKASDVLDIGLDLARGVGLGVDSWETGDPTRTLFKYVAQALARQEGAYSEYIKSGFLSTASGAWLDVLAWEVYGVNVPKPTFAAPTITLTNTGGGFYEGAAVADFVARSSSTGVQYSSVGGWTLPPGGTVTLDLVASVQGSDGTIGADEIDEIVTTLPGVVIDSSTAAAGRDRPSPEEIREQCRATTGALSPNGPSDAYEYVCRNPDLTGALDITRARAVDNSSTGTATIYVAGTSGPVLPASVVAAQTAVMRWAKPLGFTPTVVNATALFVAVTLTFSGESLPSDIEDLITDAVEAYIRAIDIGGEVTTSGIIAAAFTAHPGVRKVVVSAPALDVTAAANEVPLPGVVTAVEV